MGKLRTQLSLSIMLITFFTVAIISFFSNLLVNQEFKKYIKEQRETKAEGFVSNLNSQYNSKTQEWNIEYIYGVGMHALLDGYIIQVYNAGGEVVWDAENHNMTACKQIMNEIIQQMEKRKPDVGGEFNSHNYELTMEGKKIGSVTIRYYGPYFLSESDFNFLDTLNYMLVIIGMISLLLSLIISAILARSIARPISKIAYIAKEISEGNDSIRFLGNTKSKELDDLASSINELADGLVEQEKIRKRLTVDIAHELRTPLTALGAHLEAMIEGVWEPNANRLISCHEEVIRLSGLVTDLERLAKTESDNLILNKTEVNLMELVRFVCNNYTIEMKKKNLSLKIKGEDTFISGDKDKLSQVIANLLSNAIKYTFDGGNIQIEIKDLKDCGIFIIEDDGIGIPENELTLIFERFYRTDKSRNRKTGGAGIGLAIVKSIILAHDGMVKAESAAEKGSRFLITLPK